MLQKIEAPLYPARRWALAGFPNTGKSLFAAQMREPLLVVDADHRFPEVVRIAGCEAYDLGLPVKDYADAGLIAEALISNRGQVVIGTVVVDSLTAIIAPLVAKAMADKAAQRIKNLSAGMVKKALAMRLLQPAVTGWGGDSLWIYHLKEGRDNQGQEVITALVSKTEIRNLRRSINIQLETLPSPNYGVQITWARWGRTATLTDTSGSWLNMPKRIEVASYAPEAFESPTAAAQFAVRAGVLVDEEEAQALYESVKATAHPTSATAMATAWREALDKYLVQGAPQPAASAPQKPSALEPQQAQNDSPAPEPGPTPEETANGNSQITD